MKSEARKTLMKDLSIVGIAMAIIVTFFIVEEGVEMIFPAILAGIYFGGVPLAWRWLNNVFVVVGLVTFFVKLGASIVLGWIALPVVLIKDIVFYVKAE